MVTTDQEMGSNVGAGQAVPELGWGMAGVPHSSFPTQLSAPGNECFTAAFSASLTRILQLRGIYSGHYISTVPLVYLDLTSSVKQIGIVYLQVK